MARQNAVMAALTTEKRPDPPQRTAVLRATARGGLLNLAGAGVAAVGGLAITWLAAAALGPDAAGQFFAASSAFLLAAAVARLGTPTGLVYWLARIDYDDGPVTMGAILRAALIPAGVVSAGFAVVGVFAGEHTAAWFAGSDGAYVDMLRVLSVFVPAAVAMEALLAATRGFQRMRATVVVDKLGRTLAQLGLLVAAVTWIGGDPTAAALAWALPYLPAAVAAAWWLYRMRPARTAPPPPPESSHDTTRRFWAYTAPRALAGVAQLALQRLDILLVAGMLGFAEAAIYTVATRFVAVGQLIASAIGTAVQPRLASSLARSDHATAQRLYQSSTCWIVLTTWPFYLLTALAAPWYLRLFGPEYVTDQAVTTVWLLAGGMLVATACGVVDSVLVMAGRTGWQLYSVAGALAVNVALNLLLIPSLGILGAAVAWAAALAVNNLVPLAQLAFGVRLHPLGRGTLTAMALAGVCCGVLPAFAGLAGEPAAALAFGAGGCVYVISAWRMRKNLV
ncbi:MAG: oligosaccharide flippase family protein [Stackebrandtia sp.]